MRAGWGEGLSVLNIFYWPNRRPGLPQPTCIQGKTNYKILCARTTVYKRTVSKWEAAVDCMYTLKTSCQAIRPQAGKWI